MFCFFICSVHLVLFFFFLFKFCFIKSLILTLLILLLVLSSLFFFFLLHFVLCSLSNPLHSLHFSLWILLLLALFFSPPLFFSICIAFSLPVYLSLFLASLQLHKIWSWLSIYSARGSVSMTTKLEARAPGSYFWSSAVMSDTAFSLFSFSLSLSGCGVCVCVYVCLIKDRLLKLLVWSAWNRT